MSKIDIKALAEAVAKGEVPGEAVVATLDMGSAFMSLQEVALKRGKKVAIVVVPVDVREAELCPPSFRAVYSEDTDDPVITPGALDRMASFLEDRYEVKG